MGVDICLGGTSAIRAWREARARVSLGNQMDADDPEFRPLLSRLIRGEGPCLNLVDLPTESSLQELPAMVCSSSLGVLGPGNERVEVLLGAASGRRYFKGLACSVFGAPLPNGSLRVLREGLLVPSPEMLVVLAAHVFSQLELTLLVCELCGFYVQAPGFDVGFLASPPVMTLSGLSTYATDLEHLCKDGNHRVPNGLGKVRFACAHAVERSASPAETVCALLLCLQRRYGGYGLPKASLNGLVDADGTSFACDLLWKPQGVVVEYQGACHDAASSASQDRRKAVLLAAEGFKVIQIGKEDVRVLSRLDAVAKAISAALGVAWRPPTESFRAAQTELRRVLLAGW